MTTLRARVWKKPCAICGHGKSLHRAGYCRYQWRTMGQTWLGRQLVTKYCTCSGYQMAVADDWEDHEEGEET